MRFPCATEAHCCTAPYQSDVIICLISTFSSTEQWLPQERELFKTQSLLWLSVGVYQLCGSQASSRMQLHEIWRGPRFREVTLGQAHTVVAALQLLLAGNDGTDRLHLQNFHLLLFSLMLLYI